MFFSFLSSAKGQTTQTTPLVETRQEDERVPNAITTISPRVIIKAIIIID